MVNRTPIEEVNKWRASLYQKIARYTKMGYTIVTQDESHFKDAAMSANIGQNCAYAYSCME